MDAVRIFNFVFNKTISYCSKAVNRIDKSYGKNNTGIILALLSTIPYWLGSVIIKVSDQSSWYAFLYFRGLVGFVLGLSVMKKYKIELEIQTRKDFLQLCLRNFLSLVQASTFFFGIKYVPLSHVYIIQNTSPVITYFLDRCIYSKKIQMKDIFALFLSFLGIIFVLNPDLILNLHFGVEQVSKNAGDDSIQVKQAGKSHIIQIDMTFIVYLVQFIGSICISFSWAFTRKLKNVTSHHINLHLNFFFLAASSIYMVMSGQQFSWGFFTVLWYIFIFGMSFFVAQYAYIHGLTLASSHQVSICVYFLVIYSFIFEIIFLAQIPSLYNILGSLMLLIGLYVILFGSNDG